MIGDYQNPVFKKTVGNKFLLSSAVIGTVEEFHPASSLGEGLIENNYEPQGTKPQGTTLDPHGMNNDVPSTEASQKMVCLLQNNGNSVLSHNEFMDVASKLSNACRRNKKYGISVSAFMLQMLELSKGNNPVCIDDDLGTNLQSCFPKIIDNYKNSFNSLMKGGNVLVSSVTAPQKSLAYENTSSKRLIPAVEQARKDNDAKRIKTFAISIPKVMPKKLKKVTCSFCKGPNHKISNCPLKDSFGEKQDGHTLVKYIHSSDPFSKIGIKDVNRIINTDASGQRGFKHVNSCEILCDKLSDQTIRK